MPFGFGKKKIKKKAMNFFRQQFTSALNDVSSSLRESDKQKRNPFFNQMAEGKTGILILLPVTNFS